MSKGISLEQLDQYSFHLRKIEKVVISAEQIYELMPSAEHVMLVCVKGSGKLYTEDEVLWVSPRSTFMFPSERACRIKSREAITCYEIRFVVLHIQLTTAPIFVKEPMLTNKSEFKIYAAQQLLDMTRELYNAGRASSKEQSAFMEQNVAFIKLMGFIIHHQLVVDGERGSIAAVERTIHYLQENYIEKITVSQLEQLSELTSGQYSAIFRELTGKKPLDYVTDLRINHAKQLMQDTSQSLREIAEQVGFKDEYYFNRKFSQTIGMPPRQYAAKLKERIKVQDWAGRTVTLPVKPSRIIFYGETVEDILVLGIQPVGGGICLHDPYFDIAAAALLKPDLIIIDMENEAAFQRFSDIAPTVCYNSFESLETRLMRLGEWLDRKQEAAAWLQHYHLSKAALWSGLSTSALQGKTASVIVFHRGKRLFVIGNIGLPTIIYHEKGYSPPEAVQEIVNNNLAYKEITSDELKHYTGDVIFMLVPSSPISREACYEMLETPLWRSYQEAGKELYMIDELLWNCNDAMSLSHVVENLPELLGRER